MATKHDFGILEFGMRSWILTSRVVLAEFLRQTWMSDTGKPLFKSLGPLSSSYSFILPLKPLFSPFEAWKPSFSVAACWNAWTFAGQYLTVSNQPRGKLK